MRARHPLHGLPSWATLAVLLLLSLALPATAFAAAPNATLTFDPASPDGNAGWYRTPPEAFVTLDADGTLHYDWGSGDTTVAASAGISSEVGHAGEGVSTLSAYGVDADGDVGAPESRELRVDSLPPSMPATLGLVISPAGTELTWAASADAGSGLLGYEVYRNSDGPPYSLADAVAFVPGGTSFSEPSPGEGSWWYAVSAVDVAGNESFVSDSQLAVFALPLVTAQPSAVVASAGADVSFHAAASGIPTPSVTWQMSGDGGATYTDMAGETSETLSLTTSVADDGKLFRASFENGVGSAVSDGAALKVLSPPSVLDAPRDLVLAPGGSAVFTARASGDPAPSVQWQVSTDRGATFTDIAGATSEDLSFIAGPSDDRDLYRAVFTNDHGSDLTQPAALRVDGAPPVTILFGVPDGWSSAPVTFGLLGVDMISGVQATHYRLSGEATQTYWMPVPVSAEGTTEVSYWSVDRCGNVEQPKAENVRIDRTAPVTSFTGESSGLSSAAATFTLLGVDGGSGVQATYYRLDGDATQTYTTPVRVSTDGTNHVQYWSVDRCGNVEQPKTGTIGIDLTPPVTSIAGVPSGWSGSPATFTLLAVDTGSGVQATNYRLDGDATRTYTTPVPVSAEGTTTVRYWSVDRCGNLEQPRTASVRIDRTPPVVSSDAEATYAGPAHVTYSAVDTCSGVASIACSLDGASVVVTGGIDVTTKGDHTLSLRATDRAGNVSPLWISRFKVSTRYEEISGPDRYGTAVAASKAAFPDGARAVVLATGENWPDALTGTSLAGVEHAPLLFARPGELPPAVRSEIVRLGARRIYLLGSAKALGSSVESACVSLLGRANVTRVAGADRYETAAKVAEAVVAARGARFDGVAFFATGLDFPDALSAGPVAWRDARPILLTTAHSLPKPTADALSGARIGRAILLGGERAVDATVSARLAALTGAGVRRLGGQDRYETAALVRAFSESEGLSWDGAALTIGSSFPDALSAGPLQGRGAAVLLLTPASGLRDETLAALRSHFSGVLRFRFLGTTDALPSAVRLQTEHALGD